MACPEAPAEAFGHPLPGWKPPDLASHEAPAGAYAPLTDADLLSLPQTLLQQHRSSEFSAAAKVTELRATVREACMVLAHLRAITTRDQSPLGAHVRAEIRNLCRRSEIVRQAVDLYGDPHKDRIVLDLLRRQVAEQTAKAKTGGAK